jgi:hypothetical protein
MTHRILITGKPNTITPQIMEIAAREYGTIANCTECDQVYDVRNGCDNCREEYLSNIGRNEMRSSQDE